LERPFESDPRKQPGKASNVEMVKSAHPRLLSPPASRKRHHVQATPSAGDAWRHPPEGSMSFSIYDASAPIFVAALTNMQAWLDKALAEGKAEAALMEARLAPDMRPFPAQFQMASDSAKGAVARLVGSDPPSMPDTETSFVALKARCQATIDFIQSVDPAAFAGAETREVVLRFPNGQGYRFKGGDYLTRFALPNFLFHVTTAYALLRAAGVTVGKPDFLAHLGPPETLAGA
jgi:hypothetical protein